jgi:hypothetical protein
VTLQSLDPHSLLDPDPREHWPVVSPMWERFYALNRASSGDSFGLFRARIAPPPPET